MALSKKQTALVRSLYTRHGRKKSGRCVCEGMRCCGELYDARPDLLEFSIATAKTAEAMSIPGVCEIVSDPELAALSATVNSQGILAIARIPEQPAMDDPVAEPFILALDQVGDPGNFGTIIRTALAAGLREIWYTKGAVDPFNDKVIRSALGAQFRMKLRLFDTLDALAAQAGSFGYGPVYLTDPHQCKNCYTTDQLYQKSVVVIGSEGNGVSPLEQGIPVTIPMPGNFESLNAAQAATIFIFEYVRRITSN